MAEKEMADALTRIIRAKISLRKTQPFFSFLVEYLKYQKKDECLTCAVNGRGDFFYNEDFIQSLSFEEIKGVLLHEVFHLMLLHPSRYMHSPYTIASKNEKTGCVHQYTLWNIAIDFVADAAIIEAGFTACGGGFLVTKEDDGTYTGHLKVNSKQGEFDLSVADVTAKSANQIFHELEKLIKDNDLADDSSELGGASGGGGQGDSTRGLFDAHDFYEEDPSALPDNTNKDVWGDRVSQALAYCKSQGIGNLPTAFLRQIGELRKPKLSWRTLLRREVSNVLPTDVTWRRPARRYICMDMYLPSLDKNETAKVLLSIDTSGSMSEKELADVKSEMIGLSVQYPQTSFRLITHDDQVRDDYLVVSANRSKIEAIKLHGGGGTNHIPLFDYIDKKGYSKTVKLHINFTDGFSSFPDRSNINTLFILTGHHAQVSSLPSWGRYAELV